MPVIKFSVCPACDCESFDFYDTTGRAPGVAGGYVEGVDPSTYSGTLTFEKPDGTVVGTYSVTPSGDASSYVNVRYAADSSNSIVDGAYVVQYEVKDSNGSVIGVTRQSLVIKCELMCEAERLIDEMINSSGKARDMKVEQINALMMNARSATWVAQAGYPADANRLISIAQDYV